MRGRDVRTYSNVYHKRMIGSDVPGPTKSSSAGAGTAAGVSVDDVDVEDWSRGATLGSLQAFVTRFICSEMVSLSGLMVCNCSLSSS